MVASCVWARFPGLGKALKEAEAVIGKAVWRVRCCRIVRASLHGNTALCLSLLNTSGIAQLLSPPRRAACWPVSDQTSALFCLDFLPVLCLSQESIGLFSLSFFPVDGPLGVFIGKPWFSPWNRKLAVGCIGCGILTNHNFTIIFLSQQRHISGILICTGKF